MERQRIQSTEKNTGNATAQPPRSGSSNQNVTEQIKEQAAALQDRMGDRTWQIAGGVLGLGLMAGLAGGTRRDTLKDVPRRELDDRFVDTLAGAVRRRMKHGEGLRDALAGTLRHQAPVVLQPAPQHGRSAFATGLLGLGILGLVGAGAFLAAQRILGRNPIEAIRERTGTDETAPVPGERYGAIHGTAGARMPKPESTTPTGGSYSNVHGTAGAEMPAPSNPLSSKSTPSNPAPANPTPANPAPRSEPTVAHTEGGRLPNPDDDR